jgi:hypothetical protein
MDDYAESVAEGVDTDPPRPDLAGNPADDDPAYWGERLRLSAEPPPAPEAVVSLPSETTPPSPPTRVVGNTMAVNSAWPSPVLLSPEKLNRLAMSILVTELDAGAVALIADDPRMLASGWDQNAMVLPANILLTLDKHTGPVYARVLGAGQATFTMVETVR